MANAVSIWNNAWNQLVREKIFADEKLKALMGVPQGTKIVPFIERYFVEAGFTNQLLKDEVSRVVYSDVNTAKTGARHIVLQELSFDIYVKTSELHNVGRDRLQSRDKLIAERLAEILTAEKYVCGFNFDVVSLGGLGTRTIGYSRYNISFSYIRTV